MGSAPCIYEARFITNAVNEFGCTFPVCIWDWIFENEAKLLRSAVNVFVCFPGIEGQKSWMEFDFLILVRIFGSCFYFMQSTLLACPLVICTAPCHKYYSFANHNTCPVL